MELFSSDSDSDLELLFQLSDWDNSSDLEIQTQSDLDSDSEQPEKPVSKENKKYIVVSSKTFRRINFMVQITDSEFTFKFRMDKSSVQRILEEIMPFIKVKSRRNNGVPPLHQLLLTLRFYALGTMLNSVAEFAEVSLSSASRIVADISASIARLYDKYIVMHNRSVQSFCDIAQFPRVCGVIDCTHVQIQSPCAMISEDFRNPKGFLSLNIQAVCDANLQFMNVVAQWPGSFPDATIFNNSKLRIQCEEGILQGNWLLGDCAYPNRPYLLTPVINPSTDPEIRYNEAHIKIRKIIERTFGLWKSRFPIISMTMRLSLDTIQAVIVATAILHNICRSSDVEEVTPEVDIPEESEHSIPIHNLENNLSNVRTDVILNYF